MSRMLRLLVLIVYCFSRNDAGCTLPHLDRKINESICEFYSTFHLGDSMIDNTTLTSTSPIGSGCSSFIVTGKTQGNTSVAIKISINTDAYYGVEYKCFEQIGATVSKNCKKYGIPFIHYNGKLRGFRMMAMTLLDSDLKTLLKKFGSFSKDSILIIVRDMIRILKFIHSKGIIHQDIKFTNIMIEGANVFLCDFDTAAEKGSRNSRHSGNRNFKSIALHLGAPPAEYDDIQSLFYAMLSLAGVQLPWSNLESEKIMLVYKRRFKDVEKLCEQLKYPELIKPCEIFYKEAIESMKQKRLPRYDELYRMFDDALYNGRNRSQRIVFEWLTAEEKAAALVEKVVSIESIDIRNENAHENNRVV